MTAEIVVLADVRAARAQVTVQVSADPFAVWRAWCAYWTGDKQREKPVADVQSIGSGR